MRLFERVLRRVNNPKKPQQKFLCHVMRVLLLVPGRVPFRHLSRYSPYPEKTFARWFARAVDCVRLHHAASGEVVPAHHEPVLACAPSFVPKSGQHPPGLDMFWNGAHHRAAKGGEIATLAWVEVPQHSAYTLSVEQTPPTLTRDAAQTRLDAYLAHSRPVVTTPHLQPLP